MHWLNNHILVIAGPISIAVAWISALVSYRNLQSAKTGNVLSGERWVKGGMIVLLVLMCFLGGVLAVHVAG